jgi:hypothetical protein
VNEDLVVADQTDIVVAPLRVHEDGRVGAASPARLVPNQSGVESSSACLVIGQAPPNSSTATSNSRSAAGSATRHASGRKREAGAGHGWRQARGP